MSQADARILKGGETERKKSRWEWGEPHYICKSDSALNKILTDQSYEKVEGG